MYDEVLVPTDDSEGVQPAVDHAIDLASRMDAVVRGLFVVDTTDTAALPEAQWFAIEETLVEAGRRALADLEESAGEVGVSVRTEIRHGTPAEVIVDYASEHDVDLIVMGTHGRSGIERVLLGSVTDRVIRQSGAPVLVERIDERGATGAV